MIFRQLLEYETYTYTYLLADESSKEAALIDTVSETVARDRRLIEELGLKLKYIVETHIHADHITGNNELKKFFPEAQTVLSAASNVKFAQVLLNDGDDISLGAVKIKAMSTPGHTNTCTSYIVDGKVFTGDTLFIRGCGRTDFQEGSNKNLFHSVREKLFKLPDETLVFPGHDYKGMTCSTIGEEKQFNPRLKVTNSFEDFAAIMNGLNLAHPKKIHEAVPANLEGGR